MSMRRSKIGWTDFSAGAANFVTGCTPVSEGCKHCYAKAIYNRWGWDFSQVKIHPGKLARLARKEFPQDGNRRGPHAKPMVFVVDTGDLFHPDVPDYFIFQAIEVMSRHKDVDWQVLTKRPERMHSLLINSEGNYYLDNNDFWPNIWLGVSAENQHTADERIPLLLQIPAAVHFVSCEPLLEPIDLAQYLWPTVQINFPDGSPASPSQPTSTFFSPLEWVIVGAESGPNRRPFDKQWAIDIRDQCQGADIRYFYKQGSAVRPGQDDLLDGREWKEWPKVQGGCM